MADATTPPHASTGGIKAFVDAHPTLLIGGGIILLLLIGGAMLKKSLAPTTNPTSDPNATGADLSGLTPDGQGGHIVYVPTQTSFVTDNVGADFSNDPNLKSIATGNILTNSNPYTTTATSTTTTTTNNNPPPVVIPPTTGGGGIPAPAYYWDKDHDRQIYQDGHTVYTGKGTPGTWTPGGPDDPGPPASWGTGPKRATPPPQLNAPTNGKSLVWDSQHTMGRGETLSSVATKVTKQLQTQQGMPGSNSVQWTHLYAMNTTVITPENAAKHNVQPGGPWNDTFPGHTIVTPSYK